MDFTMNNKIFNLVAVLNEIFREIDIDFDDHIEVMTPPGPPPPPAAPPAPRPPRYPFTMLLKY